MREMRKRTLDFFYESRKNLVEAVEQYDQCDAADLVERWRIGKKIAGYLVILVLSRGRNHLSLIERLSIDLSLPSHAKMVSLPGLPLLKICCPPGAHTFLLAGIRSCATEECLSIREWRREEIYRDGEDVLTRESLLWTIRDKEGVAHFDASIDSCSAYSALFERGHENYYYQKLENEVGTVIRLRDTSIYNLNTLPSKGSSPAPALETRYPLLGGVDGVVRTIAAEVLFALESHGQQI